uniref:Uncharacterized protein n=1 Tax=Malurus cyaneus samueli TaxID=2593467 RepID=A0A8C5U2Q0_9PASS
MTSLTQRSSGLVQRRTEASRSAAADKEREAGGGPEDEGRRDEPGDDEKGDSKETRLTLMEEVLLLGLKDREVRPGALSRGWLTGYPLFRGLWRLLMGKGNLSGVRARVGWEQGRCWVSVAVGLAQRRCGGR